MLKRTFVLGEDWVFLKIYTGINTADRLVSAQVFTLAASLESEGIIQKWFFIRYSDANGFHLRVRFCLAETRYLAELIERIGTVLKPLIDDNIVRSIAYDTYFREIERYGESVYPQTEEIFHIDSICVAACLSQINQQAGDVNLRWTTAVAMINDLLDAASISLLEKKEIIVRCRDSFRREFEVEKPEQTRLFDKKYRDNRKSINEAVDHNCFPQEIFCALERRKNALKTVTDTWERINIPSILHMTCNRMFITSNRLCELTIYEYLSRYYVSEIARQKYNKEASHNNDAKRCGA